MDGLMINTSLQGLFLDHNRIGDDGGVYLGEALKENATVEHLSLAGNAIADRGGTELFEVRTEGALLLVSYVYDRFWRAVYVVAGCAGKSCASPS